MHAYVSLWSADLLAVGAAVDLVDASADGYHIDVFDGHNVRDLLFGPDFVSALRRRTSKPIEVHLMVTDPDYWSERFIEAGADVVSVQTSTSGDIRATLRRIRSLGARASLGLETREPTSHAASLFDDLDRVLLMGTAIGIKGVSQDPATEGRVAELVAHRTAAGRAAADLPVFVDGGIRPQTVQGLAGVGCDGVIPGSLVFGDADPVAAIGRLHALLAGAPAAH